MYSKTSELISSLDRPQNPHINRVKQLAQRRQMHRDPLRPQVFVVSAHDAPALRLGLARVLLLDLCVQHAFDRLLAGLVNFGLQVDQEVASNVACVALSEVQALARDVPGEPTVPLVQLDKVELTSFTSGSQGCFFVMSLLMSTCEAILVFDIASS